MIEDETIKIQDYTVQGKPPLYAILLSVIGLTPPIYVWLPLYPFHGRYLFPIRVVTYGLIRPAATLSKA
jgi:hypothetical protein